MSNDLSPLFSHPCRTPQRGSDGHSKRETMKPYQKRTDVVFGQSLTPSQMEQRYKARNTVTRGFDAEGMFKKYQDRRSDSLSPKLTLDMEAHLSRQNEQRRALYKTRDNHCSPQTTRQLHKINPNSFKWEELKTEGTEVSSLTITPDENPRRVKGRTKLLSQGAATKKAFSIETPKQEQFVPIVPSGWLEGRKPDRSEISTNTQLYADMRSYQEDSVNWRQANELEYLPFYANAERISVLTCTWNVNQGVFSREEIDRWTSGVKYGPDIIICGLQELEMSFDAIVTGKKYSEKSVLWEKLLLSSINRGTQKYLELGYYQLCGVVLYVFHKQTLSQYIKEVGFQDCRVGAMSGTLANKGGVAYRMKIYDTTLCFVVSHLAAHQQFVERRNQDWSEISKMKISYFNSSNNTTTSTSILSHDVVIWMGDLNYRINMEDSVVRRCIKSKNYMELSKHDQLIGQMKLGRVFNKFVEAPLTFAPTFKIKIGENEYKENRIPAWCDRVLFKTERNHFVEVKKYTSHEIYSSDHKPVSCLLNVDVQRVDTVKKGVVEQYLDQVQSCYERYIEPSIEITPAICVVENIELFKDYHVSVRMKNNGVFPTAYEIENSNDCHYHEDWLTIKRSEGFIDILEGNDTAVVELDIMFDRSIVWMYQDRNMLMKKVWLAFGKKRESFTIIIKTPVSVIGMRLESLNILAKPLIGNAIPGVGYSSTPFMVPKEIYRLVDYIKKHYQKGCFCDIQPKPYSNEQMRTLIETVNRERPFEDFTIYLYCDLLMLIISGLRRCTAYHPLPRLFKTKAVTVPMLLQHINYVIPLDYNHLFIYIISFMKYLVKVGEDAETLVSRFTPHLFRCYEDDLQAPYCAFISLVVSDTISINNNTLCLNN